MFPFSPDDWRLPRAGPPAKKVGAAPVNHTRSTSRLMAYGSNTQPASHPKYSFLRGWYPAESIAYLPTNCRVLNAVPSAHSFVMSPP